MKIAAAYDIVFIIALAVILVLINELGIQDDLFRFRYIGFLLGYFSGRYVSGLIYRSKLREQTNRSEKHKMLKWASTVFLANIKLLYKSLNDSLITFFVRI